MSNLKPNLCAILAVASLATAGPALADRPSADANVIAGQYVVVYDGSAESVRAETDTREAKLGFETDLRFRHALRGFAGALTPGQARELRRDPDVARVVPDRVVQATAQVPVAGGDQVPTGLRRAGLATTASVEHRSGAAVAVLDTGVDLEHPDLEVSDGTNCLTPGASSDDDNGHGTHVAGTIAAKNNGAGVVGVAPGTRIWAVKVLDSTARGTFSSIICGLDWVTANAAAKNIKVANMSLSGSGQPVATCATTVDPFHLAVCQTVAADVLPVVAAGNEGWDFDYVPSPDVPAAFPEALTVTALSDSDGRGGGTGGAPSCRLGELDDRAASFSNFAKTAAGAAHTIAAPGVCIRSTWPKNLSSSGYATASGTSMATPLVAGLAALCEDHDDDAGPCAGRSPAGVMDELLSRAQSHTLASPLRGFVGDPAHGPVAGFHYGYLAAFEDFDAPDTSIASAPPSLTASTSASFAFSATEAGVRFECRLDGNGWTPCAAAHEETELAEGAHTLSVRAIDAPGNVDPSPASHTWAIDTTPPGTEIASGPASPTASKSASFTFSSTEPGARFECRLDDADQWSACGSVLELAALGNGTHTLGVRAIDGLGNVDPTPASYTWAVDAAPPDTSIVSVQSPVPGARSASFEFAATEAGVRFECKLDDGAWSACAQATELSRLAGGSHTLSVRAIDQTGNTDDSPALHTWSVDATPPDTAIVSAPASTTGASSAGFEFSAEPGARFECRLDGAAWSGCGPALELTGVGHGRHTLRVRAIDAAGNVDPSPAAHTWSIDLAAPDTAIVHAPAGAINSRSATFRFSAEAGTRFECRQGDDAWSACESTLELAEITDGSHTLSVRAIDQAGNADDSPASRTWSVDATPPDTSVSAGPPEVGGQRRARFAFAATEAGRFQCRADDEPWSACAPQADLGEMAEGPHTLAVRAIDALGNVDPSPAVHAWTVLPSTEQIDFAMAADLSGLAERLRALGLGRLVRRQGFRASGLKALLPGRFSISLVGASGEAGIARRVLLARGTRSVSRAGTYALRANLTRGGRRAMRDDDRARVVLVVRFRDDLGRMTVTRRAITLTRARP
ncbi:MAG TPA: S8 family serine peptidase [Thermoleophilaceae bacterium]|nr:S8 family serine peptidase [Thermoleophilaceae bacterium]